MAFISFITPVEGRSGRIVSPETAEQYQKLRDNPRRLLRLSKKRQNFILNIKKIHGSQYTKVPDYQKPLIPGASVYDERYR